MKFLTIWSWYCLTAYMLLGSWAARRHYVRRRRGTTGPPQHLDHVVAALFQGNLLLALLVDIYTWAVLYPMVRVLPGWEHVHKILFTWVSFNQHGFNLLFLLGDLWFSGTPPMVYLSGYVGLLVTGFVAWAFAHDLAFKKPLYPFLDLTQDHASVRFLALYAGFCTFLWLSYRLQQGIRRLKRLVVPGKHERL